MEWVQHKLHQINVPTPTRRQRGKGIEIGRRRVNLPCYVKPPCGCTKGSLKSERIGCSPQFQVIVYADGTVRHGDEHVDFGCKSIVHTPIRLTAAAHR